jgi:rod shape-determining protein MreC
VPFKNSFFIIAAIVVVMFFWLTYQSLKGESHAFDFVLFPLTYLQKSSSYISTHVFDFFNHYILITQKARENEELRKVLSKCQEQENIFREVIAENERLREILELKNNDDNFVAAAEVYAMSATNWFRTVRINKGQYSGIFKDMAVASPAGLVGRIYRSFPHSADVIFITDPNFAAAVRFQTSRVEGILVGKGRGKCMIKYVSHDVKIEEEEVVITSGLDNIFPKGLVVGRVSEIDEPEKRGTNLFQYIEVIPAVNLDTVEEVVILNR